MVLNKEYVPFNVALHVSLMRRKRSVMLSCSNQTAGVVLYVDQQQH